MNKNIGVSLNNGKYYDIFIRKDFSELKEAILSLFPKSRFMFVFDTNTEGYFKENLIELLSELKDRIEFFVFEAGEENKNLTVVSNLYTRLIESKFERGDVLVAVGGGVVGDLTGFTAATYLRGISFIQVPTTLLAMSDSSIGGKTGVDFLSYKNMIGAFKQPSLVYIATDSLDTLGKREYLSGLAEVIKYGYICEKEFISYLDIETEKIMNKVQSSLSKIIEISCLAKKRIVEEDTEETGVRAILNFGHTVGHAIEKLTNFTLLHGECVALGMLSSARISLNRGLISFEEFEKLRSLLKKFGFKIRLEKPKFTVDDVIFATKLDKKMCGGLIKFILLEEVGRAGIYTDITEKELRNGIEEVF